MPMVNGKRFPYTAKGKKEAEAYAMGNKTKPPSRSPKKPAVKLGRRPQGLERKMSQSRKRGM